jgi:hypothetical protein
MDEALVIIPCGQAKLWDDDPQRGPTPARDAYTGAPFKVNRAYAERHGDRWVILSAKYGFCDSTSKGDWDGGPEGQGRRRDRGRHGHR